VVGTETVSESSSILAVSAHMYESIGWHLAQMFAVPASLFGRISASEVGVRLASLLQEASTLRQLRSGRQVYQ
jgi:hypothetical protein